MSNRERFAPLVAQFRVGQTELEADDAYVVVLAVFDHDYHGYHLLVQQWDRTAPEHGWVYALWFVDPCGELASLVRAYPGKKHGTPPFLGAGVLIECWCRHGSYGGQSDLDPAQFC